MIFTANTKKDIASVMRKHKFFNEGGGGGKHGCQKNVMRQYAFFSLNEEMGGRREDKRNCRLLNSASCLASLLSVSLQKK